MTNEEKIKLLESEIAQLTLENLKLECQNKFLNLTVETVFLRLRTTIDMCEIDYFGRRKNEVT